MSSADFRFNLDHVEPKVPVTAMRHNQLACPGHRFCFLNAWISHGTF